MKPLFSSWNNEIVDNRGIDSDRWHDAPLVKLPPEYDKENSISAFMGWAGIILIKDSVDVVEMCSSYIGEVQKESCGKCFPCRIGTAIMEGILAKIINGKGNENDLNQLETLGKYISESSKCYVGKTGPVPILHALKYFKDDFSKIITGKKPIKTNLPAGKPQSTNASINALGPGIAV